MILSYRLFVAISIAILLGACSKLPSLPGSQLFDRSNRVAPLPVLKPVTAKIQTSSSWQVDTGSSMGENKIHPYLDKRVVYIAGGVSASAWSKNNGKQLWKTTIGEVISAGVNGTLLSNPQANLQGKSAASQIFIGTTSGNAISLDAKTGKIQWIERLSSEVLSVSPSQNNRVVFRTIDGKLHALSATSGELVWQRSQTTPALSSLGAGVPVIVSSLVIAGFDNGKVAAYDLQTGRRIWEVTLALPQGNTELERMVDIDGKIKPLGNALFAASLNGSSSGINMETGKQVWSRAFSSPTGANANAVGFYSSDDKGNVWRIDPRNGAPLWSMDDLKGRQPTVPALMGNTHLIVADKQGNIHWINTDSGRFTARNKGDTSGYSVEPEVDGNSVYTMGKKGILNKFILN